MAAIPYIPTIVIDDVITALAAFLQPFVGSDTPIVRAQVNRVPPPLTAFVMLRELFEVDLETSTFVNVSAYLQGSIATPTRISIQIDFYGPSAGDWCKAVKAVYRSQYAPNQFPDGIKPLWCSDGHQIPLITGEEQYENRWSLTAELQYNPIVTVPQQSATVLAVNIFEDLQ